MYFSCKFINIIKFELTINNTVKISNIKPYIIFSDKEFLKILKTIYSDYKNSKKTIKNIQESTKNKSIIKEVDGPGLLAGDTIRLIKAIKRSITSNGNIDNAALEKEIQSGTVAGSFAKTTEFSLEEIGNLISIIIDLLKKGFTIGIIAAIIITLINNSDKISAILSSIGKGLYNIAEKLFDNDIKIAYIEFNANNSKYVISFDLSDFDWEIDYAGFKGWMKNPENDEINEIFLSAPIKEFFKTCAKSAEDFYINHKELSQILSIILLDKNIDKKYKNIFKGLIENKNKILENMKDPDDITIKFKESKNSNGVKFSLVEKTL